MVSEGARGGRGLLRSGASRTQRLTCTLDNLRCLAFLSASKILFAGRKPAVKVKTVWSSSSSSKSSASRPPLSCAMFLMRASAAAWEGEVGSADPTEPSSFALAASCSSRRSSRSSSSRSCTRWDSKLVWGISAWNLRFAFTSNTVCITASMPWNGVMPSASRSDCREWSTCGERESRVC